MTPLLPVIWGFAFFDVSVTVRLGSLRLDSGDLTGARGFRLPKQLHSGMGVEELACPARQKP